MVGLLGVNHYPNDCLKLVPIPNEMPTFFGWSLLGTKKPLVLEPTVDVVAQCAAQDIQGTAGCSLESAARHAVCPTLVA